MDLLWPDLLLEQAAPRLHKAAHYARAALGVPTAVVLSGDVVALLPDAQVAVDVELFDEAAGDPTSAGEAIDLYRGDLLPEDLYEPWADAERERLRIALPRSCSARPGAGPTWSPPSRSTRRRTCGWSSSTSRTADRSQALRQLDSMARLWRDELGAEPGAAARPCARGRRRCRRVDAGRLAPTGTARPACHAPRPGPSGRDADVGRGPHPARASTGW